MGIGPESARVDGTDSTVKHWVCAGWLLCSLSRDEQAPSPRFPRNPELDPMAMHDARDPRAPARRLDSVEISGIREIVEELGRWSGGARAAIPFHLGMPDFDTPEHIKAAAVEALDEGFVGYTASRGILPLREAIARKLERENGIGVDPNREIVVTCGANEAIGAAILGHVDPGDEVIVPDPAWPHYEYCLRLAGATPVPCRLRAEDGFAMMSERVAELWTPRTRMVVLNSPHNPTGGVTPPEQIRALANLVQERGAWLLSDEPYERIVHDGEHLSPASLSGMQDSVLTVGCLSKTYAMTGWRLGWLAGPPAAADAVNKIHLYTVTCAVSFVQRAGVAALDGDQRCVDEMVAEYRRRRDLVTELLTEIPDVRMEPPAGAFYAFPDVSAYGTPSRQLARELVRERGIGAVHGTAFGPAGEGHLRIAYTCSEASLREGIARLAEHLEEKRTA